MDLLVLLSINTKNGDKLRFLIYLGMDILEKRSMFNNTYYFHILMSKRVTVMIDDDLDKKLRSFQARTIQRESSSYSFSQALNDTLRKVLK